MSWLVVLRPTRGEMAFEPTEDEAEARAIVAADPAVVSGAMTAEIRPFRIAVR